MDIQRAIHVLQDCVDAAEGTEFAQVYQMAISALQEQAERKEGCPWCNKGLRFESYLIDDEGNTASIENNEVQTCIAKFCPVCGRRLYGDDGDEF